MCAMAPRRLVTEKAARTMTVLRHALRGDDFHQGGTGERRQNDDCIAPRLAWG